METLACHQCGHQWQVEAPVARSESCEACGWDARVCLNCNFYDAKVYRECREPQAEYVQDKDKSNFCGYFKSSGRGKSGPGQEQIRAQSALNQLFGGGAAAAPKDGAEASLKAQLEAFMNKKGR